MPGHRSLIERLLRIGRQDDGVRIYGVRKVGKNEQEDVSSQRSLERDPPRDGRSVGESFSGTVPHTARV